MTILRLHFFLKSVLEKRMFGEGAFFVMTLMKGEQKQLLPQNTQSFYSTLHRSQVMYEIQVELQQ